MAFVDAMKNKKPNGTMGWHKKSNWNFCGLHTAKCADKKTETFQSVSANHAHTNRL